MFKMGLNPFYEKEQKKKRENCKNCYYRENWKGLGSVCAYGIYNPTTRPCSAEKCTVKLTIRKGEKIYGKKYN